MGELDCDRHVGMSANQFQNLGQRGLVLVRPEAEIVRADAAFRHDSRRLDNQEACARQRKVAQVNRMPIRRAAILGRILAHGRNHDAVAHVERADLKGSEKRAHSG